MRIAPQILGLDFGGQCLIQAVGLCWYAWSWAVYKVYVRRGPLSLLSLTLILCLEWHSAHVQGVMDQGSGGHGCDRGGHLSVDFISYQESSWRS